MSVPAIPPLLAGLTADLILACDRQAVVHEASAAARHVLGPAIVGKPFVQLLTTMARSKGEAFITSLAPLQPGETSEPWELHFHLPRAAPLLASVRGGVADDRSWLIVGTGPPPHLTALYHEALAINNDLTTLVRQLTKEQALLRQRLEGLLEHRRATAMDEAMVVQVAQRLDDQREELSRRVAEQLTAELPMIGISPEARARHSLHFQRMFSTAQRFHDMVQMGVKLEWGLVGHEYRWTAQVLQPLGITWDHQCTLIDSYFAAARELGDWGEQDQAVLRDLEAKLRGIGVVAYAAE